MTITVDNPQDNDHASWVQLYRAYAVFYNVPMPDDTLDTVWAWIADPKMPFWCRLARTADHTVCGFMHFRAMPSPLRGSHIGFLDDLFVDSSVRGHGVVDALFADLTKQAKLQQWPTVRWITADDNYRARAVYDRLARKTAWNTYQLDIEA